MRVLIYLFFLSFNVTIFFSSVSSLNRVLNGILALQQVYIFQSELIAFDRSEETSFTKYQKSRVCSNQYRHEGSQRHTKLLKANLIICTHQSPSKYLCFECCVTFIVEKLSFIQRCSEICFPHLKLLNCHYNDCTLIKYS